MADLESMRARARFVRRHADAVFLDSEETWRQQISWGLGTRMFLGSSDCTGERDVNAKPFMARTEMMGSVEYRPWDVALSLFSSGRMDGAVITEPDTSPDLNTDTVGYLRGLIGVGVRIKGWLSVAISRIGADPIEADDPYWDARSPADGDPGPRALLEVGVPALGVVTQLTRRGAEVDVREVSVRDVALSEGLRATLAGRVLPAEDRWLVAPKATYGFFRSDEASLDLGLEAGFGTKAGAGRLRHVRAIAENVLLDSKLTRNRGRKFGARVEQNAALSVHRGALMQQLSGAAVAIGIEYEVSVGLQTPHFYMFFDFGLSFNQVEMLDLLPVQYNRGMLTFGLNLSSRW